MDETSLDKHTRTHPGCRMQRAMIRGGERVERFLGYFKTQRAKSLYGLS